MPTDTQPTPGDPTAPTPPREIKPGPKLTSTERAIVAKVVATYHDITVALQVLAEEYPELPPLSADNLRYYRRKLYKSGVPDSAKEAWGEVLTIGLAQRGARIANLQRQAEDLVRRISTMGDSPVRARYVGEYREYLKQIAQETGQPMGTVNQQIKVAVGASVASAGAAGDLSELSVVLDALVQSREEMAAALAGSQRPDPEDLE